MRLFELADPGVEDCRVIYRAKLRSENLDGRAYLEMWCRLPDGGEYFSKSVQNPVSGTTDWASYEIPFLLKKGQRPRPDQAQSGHRGQRHRLDQETSS